MNFGVYLFSKECGLRLIVNSEGLIHLTLGPRVIKTGIAVTLALYICYFFDFDPAVFAGVAAIFAVQPSIYRTWKHLLDQVVTNTMGAAIALFVIYFVGNEPIIIGMVMIIVILVSLKMKMENTISLTLVTILAIMGAPSDEGIWFAANRFLIILIGIASAFVVNISIFPPKYKKNFIEKNRTTFQNMSLLMRTAISNELTEKSFQEDYTKLNKDLKQLEEYFKILDEERAKMSKLNPQDAREIVVFKQMLKCLQKGEEVLEIIEEHYFQSNSSEEDSELFDEQIEQLIKCHEYFLLKYEGKIRAEEQREEDEVLIQCSLFLGIILEKYRNEGGEKLRLVVIGSSIFEYAFQLQRLNQLIEKYRKTVKKSKQRIA